MRVIDLSWFQYPVDTAATAPAADGFIVRWCDWVRWANYGGDEDTGHNDVIRGFQAQGKLASSYLFARPEMCAATQQIDTWASRVNAELTMPPLLDIEQSGITGNQLMDWTEEALTRMRVIWGWTPLHYFSASLAGKLGTWRPSAPHLLMVPGYPYRNDDRSRYRWDQRDQWVTQAGGEAAVADYLPPGYNVSDVALWQFADTGQVPGTNNTVDVSNAYPAFVGTVGGGQVGPIGTTGTDIVDLARTQVGVKESPPNSNQVLYWDWWGANYGAWCAVFVSYIFHEAGVPLPAVNGPLGFIHCPSGQMFAYRNGQSTTAPEPGDIVIFSWEPWEMRDGIATCTTGSYAGQAAGDHTGIFIHWNSAPGGSFTCIEGNTSQTSWDNGGAVMERIDRNASQVCCWWRPPGLSTGLRTASIDPDEQFWTELMADPRIQQLMDIIPLVKATYWATGNQMPAAGAHTVSSDARDARNYAEAVFWMTGNQWPKTGVETLSTDARETRKAVEALKAGAPAQVSTPVPVVDVEASLEQATVQQLSAALTRKLAGS